jgi:hypothetical protein
MKNVTKESLRSLYETSQEIMEAVNRPLEEIRSRSEFMEDELKSVLQTTMYIKAIDYDDTDGNLEDIKRKIDTDENLPISELQAIYAHIEVLIEYLSGVYETTSVDSYRGFCEQVVPAYKNMLSVLATALEELRAKNARKTVQQKLDEAKEMITSTFSGSKITAERPKMGISMNFYLENAKHKKIEFLITVAKFRDEKRFYVEVISVPTNEDEWEDNVFGEYVEEVESSFLSKIKDVAKQYALNRKDK